MMKNIQYVSSIETSDEYTLEEFNKFALDFLSEIKEQEKVKYPEPEYQFELVIEPTNGDDYSEILISVFRSETPDEKLKRELEEKERDERNAKVAAEKQHIIDLKEARLTIAKGDPDYEKYIKLKEKFKDLD